MTNLANMNAALGRHADALMLQEQVLAFFLRVLPEDHPHLGKVDVF